MSFPLFRVWVSLSFCGFAAAQTRAPAPPGTIAGMVVDAGNNSPIRRAVVTLSTVEAHPQDAVAWTDSSGRFAFGYLPPGRYELRVDKNGFQPARYGADSPRRPPGAISLAAGEIRSDLVFRLQQVITILGTVTDEQGDPLPGVSVSAMRWGWQRQKRRLLPGSSAMTGADGHYRLSVPAPGSYAIVASKSGAPLPVRSESVPGETQRPYMYGTQFYAGTDRAESATLFPVEAGREYASIDFHLTARPSPIVQGKIVPPTGISMFERITVNASSEDAFRGRFGTGVSGSDFVFRFDQLQPGRYTLVAQATAGGKRYGATQSVEIPSEGIQDLSLVLQPSIDLAGTVTVEGPDAAKYTPTSVTLIPGDGASFNGPGQLSAAVSKDGGFKIGDVPPGIWDINPGPVPPGGYIKSMHLGDQDVLTEEMVIDSSTRAPLKIVFGTRAAQLVGEVTQNDQPVRAVVVLAPEPRFRHVISFYRTVTADASGHFEIKNAAPGKYELYAFDELDPQLIQDPEFLKSFEPTGVAVTLREGNNAPQQLGLISPNPATASRGGVQ